MYTRRKQRKAEKPCQDHTSSPWASSERKLKQVLKPWQGFCDFNEEPQASLIPKKVRAECAWLVTLSSNYFEKITAVILPQLNKHYFNKESPSTLLLILSVSFVFRVQKLCLWKLNLIKKK